MSYRVSLISSSSRSVQYHCIFKYSLHFGSSALKAWIPYSLYSFPKNYFYAKYFNKFLNFKIAFSETIELCNLKSRGLSNLPLYRQKMEYFWVCIQGFWFWHYASQTYIATDLLLDWMGSYSSEYGK